MKMPQCEHLKFLKDLIKIKLEILKYKEIFGSIVIKEELQI